jgi:hypothetical protein
MDIDYLFYRRPAKPGPYSLDDLGDVTPPIGAGATVREGLKRLFAQLDWRESGEVPGAWFGTGGPTFQLTEEVNGEVTSFMGSHLEPYQMLRLVHTMDLIALDLQRDIVFA